MYVCLKTASQIVPQTKARNVVQIFSTMSSGYLSTVETRSRERRRIRRQRRQVIDPALPVVPRIPLGFIPQIDELDGPFTNPRTRRQFYRQPLLFWELDQIREMRAGPSQQRWYYRVNYSALDGNLAGEGYTLDWTMLPESDAWGWQRFDIRGFDIPIANTPWEETDGGWHISFEAGNEHQWTTFGCEP